MKFEKWSDFLAKGFIDPKTLRVEEEAGDLKLYHYFSTLRWRQCFAIVYKDMFLREEEGSLGEEPLDEWDMSVDMVTVDKQLQNEKAADGNVSDKSNFPKELDEIRDADFSFRNISADKMNAVLWAKKAFPEEEADAMIESCEKNGDFTPLIVEFAMFQDNLEKAIRNLIAEKTGEKPVPTGQRVSFHNGKEMVKGSVAKVLRLSNSKGNRGWYRYDVRADNKNLYELYHGEFEVLPEKTLKHDAPLNVGTKAFVKFFDEGIPVVITGVKNPDNGLGEYVYTAVTKDECVLTLSRGEFSILEEDMEVERRRSRAVTEEEAMPEEEASVLHEEEPER